MLQTIKLFLKFQFLNLAAPFFTFGENNTSYHWDIIL